MAVYFFLVITSFWILKPLKKSLFIEFYDQNGFDFLGWQMTAAQAELLAKAGNMLVALVAATVFAVLARRLRRQQLTYIFAAFSILCYLLFGFLLRDPHGPTVWGFYLYGDLFNTLMVPTFFAFLNDSVTPRQAKRLYGLIILGGVLGGAVGSTFVRTRLEAYSHNQWMWICLLIAGGIIIIAFLAARSFGFKPEQEVGRQDQTSNRNPFTEGARLVFSSRYLFSIVMILGLYEMVSTIIDFQFTSAVGHYLDGPAIGHQFSTVYALTNWIGFLVQLFLTGFIMTRFGVGAALLFLPVAALLSSVGFLFTPLLLFGSAMSISDNALNYSINQSGREALYVPTTREEKYKAKAFIDMFIQRFAKAVAVGLSLLITTFFAGFTNVRWLSVATIIILVVWIQAARFAGREFQRLAAESDAEREQ
jgi:AAA family ATP:ADP antiporter